MTIVWYPGESPQMTGVSFLKRFGPRSLKMYCVLALARPFVYRCNAMLVSVSIYFITSQRYRGAYREGCGHQWVRHYSTGPPHSVEHYFLAKACRGPLQFLQLYSPLFSQTPSTRRGKVVFGQNTQKFSQRRRRTFLFFYALCGRFSKGNQRFWRHWHFKNLK